jgi:hypothetical protein
MCCMQLLTPLLPQPPPQRLQLPLQVSRRSSSLKCWLSQTDSLLHGVLQALVVSMSATTNQNTVPIVTHRGYCCDFCRRCRHCSSHPS